MNQQLKRTNMKRRGFFTTVSAAFTALVAVEWAWAPQWARAAFSAEKEIDLTVRRPFVFRGLNFLSHQQMMEKIRIVSGTNDVGYVSMYKTSEHAFVGDYAWWSGTIAEKNLSSSDTRVLEFSYFDSERPNSATGHKAIKKEFWAKLNGLWVKV